MNNNVNTLRLAIAGDSAIDTLLRDGARLMLQQAIEREVADYVAAHQDCRDDSGQRLVVRIARHRRGGHVAIHDGHALCHVAGELALAVDVLTFSGGHGSIRLRRGLGRGSAAANQ